MLLSFALASTSFVGTCDGALLSFPRTYLDAADAARGALRIARESGHRRLKIELPVLQPECTVESVLLPGSGANTWPGGAAQSHKSGLQPVVTPLLQGYEPNFLGMIDVGMGVWSLANGDVTAVSNVADLSFDTFAKLCDGEFGAAPTRADHTLLLLNPRLTTSKAIGQPWQRELRQKAVAYVDETDWLWAYRCKPIAARGGLSSEGVVVSSELDGLRGSSVFTMEGDCVAESDDPDAFYSGTSTRALSDEARQALRERRAPPRSRSGPPPRMCAATEEEEKEEEEGGAAATRLMKWAAQATACEPCDGSMAAFLAGAASTDLIVRTDDSVIGCEAVAGTSPQQYRATITPLKLPGLTVEPSAVCRVEAVQDGVRSTLERCDIEYSGRFGKLVKSLPMPDISAYTGFCVRNGDSLVADSSFELCLPLPSWWPIPDRAMEALGMNALIQRLVEKDTRLSVARIKAEHEASLSSVV